MTNTAKLRHWLAAARAERDQLSHDFHHLYTTLVAGRADTDTITVGELRQALNDGPGPIADTATSRLGHTLAHPPARDGYNQAIQILRDVHERTGSPAAQWAVGYLTADPDRQAPPAPQAPV